MCQGSVKSSSTPNPLPKNMGYIFGPGWLLFWTEALLLWKEAEVDMWLIN